MYTQCPNCDTAFRIGIPQLKAAQGKVRCGHCENVFNALLNLSEQAQEIPTVNDRAGHHAPPAGAITQANEVAQDLPNLQSPAREPSPLAASTSEAVAKPAVKPRFTVVDDASEKNGTTPAEPVAPVATANPTSIMSGRSGATARKPAQDSFKVNDTLSDSSIPTPSTSARDETAELHNAVYFEPLPEFPPDNEEQPAVDKQRREPVLDRPRQHTPKTRREMIVSTPRNTADRLRKEQFPTELPIFVPDRRSMPRLPEKDVTDYDALEDYPREEIKKTYHWQGTAAWTLGILALLAVLIVQYAYFMRADLAGYPALRPGLEKFCAAVKTFAECDIPLRRDLAQIEKQNSEVIAHPEVPDALRVSTTLINKANFPQPYPYLQVTLAGIDGAVIAKRRFHPNEYLGANVNIKRGMQPGDAVPVALEVATPNTDFNLQSWSIDLF